jgi:hypothetical protein
MDISDYRTLPFRTAREIAIWVFACKYMNGMLFAYFLH